MNEELVIILNYVILFYLFDLDYDGTLETCVDCYCGCARSNNNR